MRARLFQAGFVSLGSVYLSLAWDMTAGGPFRLRREACAKSHQTASEKSRTFAGCPSSFRFIHFSYYKAFELAHIDILRILWLIANVQIELHDAILFRLP